MFSFVNMKKNSLEYLLTDGLYKEVRYGLVSGRYITNSDLENFMGRFRSKIQFEKIGESVEKKAIYKCKVGRGDIKILAWSQMHGNESTTTKAIFDLLCLSFMEDEIHAVKEILNKISLHIIPILNPDGAEVYTRLNANKVDLNRDLQKLNEPESRLLKEEFEKLHPDYCLNLHDQRTIFSAGETSLPATLSFLTPSKDEERSIDLSRQLSMSIISGITAQLNNQIPGQIGRYDDAFNLNCAGDIFQAEGCPTLLFEAGHYPGDYEREITRKYVFKALVSCIYQIAIEGVNPNSYSSYFKIPENAKLFNDVIIRQAKWEGNLVDVSIQFKEELRGGRIEFEPVVEKISNRIERFGHKEINAKGRELSLPGESELSENVVVNKIVLNAAELQVKSR